MSIPGLLYLFADSQPLFWQEKGPSWLASRVGELGVSNPQAAYLGASNGDEPAFFDIFQAACQGAGLVSCRHIFAQPDVDQMAYLQQSHLILLAGGDVKRGWEAFCQTGVREALLERHHAGAILMGISAGAMQLGMASWGEDPAHLFPALGLVPAIISVHEESDWPALRRALRFAKGDLTGLGIPSGSGVCFHASIGFKRLRHPVLSLSPTGQSHWI